jgi:hypothetical protein
MEIREHHSYKNTDERSRNKNGFIIQKYLSSIYLNILYIQVNVFHKAVMVDGSYGVILPARRRGGNISVASQT